MSQEEEQAGSHDVMLCYRWGLCNKLKYCQVGEECLLSGVESHAYNKNLKENNMKVPT